MPNIAKTSEALKINLEATKIHSYIFSAKELLIIQSVSNHPSVKNRIMTFFKELHHPYPDKTQIIEDLRWIILNNLWIFSELPEKQTILEVFGEAFFSIMKMNLDTIQLERLKNTLFNTLETVYSIYETGKFSYVQFRSCLDIFDHIMSAENSGLMESSGSIKKFMVRISKDPQAHSTIFRILKKALVRNILYWKNIPSFSEWFSDTKTAHETEYREIESAMKQQFPEIFFDETVQMIQKASGCEALFAIPDFTYFTDRLRNTTDYISSTTGKIYFIFYLLELEPMIPISEYLLFDLNRTLKQISLNETKNAKLVISRIFNFFKPVKHRFSHAILECIKTLGIEIVKKGDHDLADHFFDAVIDYGFIYPDIKGVNQDWQMIVDKNHVRNIRTWLEIIEVDPDLCTKLLSGLLINLRTGGVFISDTDLFQTDITKFLNSKISSAYHIARQIAVLFPVYFNEIGAEGELRKISTAIDEMSQRKDSLVHFLRKQIHAESNNTHIGLVKDIFTYWLTGEKKHLQNKIPADIYVSLNCSEDLYAEVHQAATALNNAAEQRNLQLFSIRSEQIEDLIKECGITSEAAQIKTGHLLKLHLLLKEKYYLNPGHITEKLRKQLYIPVELIEKLESEISTQKWKNAVKTSFAIMDLLKKTVLSPEKTEGIENIYYKRHIAIGIPSMYGDYREPKFDALGLIFRMEQMVSSIIEKVISAAKLNYISAETLKEVSDTLEMFREGLELGGITSENFNSDLKTLSYSLVSSSFSIDQFTNIFEYLAEDTGKIVVDYYLGIHDKNLKKILEQQIEKECSGKLSEKEKECHIHKRSEEFYRDVISSSFLMQQMDSLINSVLSILREMPRDLPDETVHVIMSYRSDLITASLTENNPVLDNRVFLGAKGYFLKKIKEYGIPVPPGFVLTTELFRRRNALVRHPEIKKEIRSLIFGRLNNLEKQTGLEFGNPQNPLLLSIRSGSAISMPGAMNTFLNVGMNDDFVKKLSKKENYAWTSWDCYRRLIQSWGMNYGIDRDIFDILMADFKKTYKVAKKIEFKPAVMREIANEYMKVLEDRNVPFEQDMSEQLMISIRSVFDSWDSRKAQVYREKLKIAPEWGTAVIVQKMVLGNINYDSGTGVVFTREPFTGEKDVRLYGDFVMCSQGEDVVGGLVHPYPVTEKQRIAMKDVPSVSMEKDFPEIFSALLEISSNIVNKKGFGHQEIEFTFETQKKKDLHILQIRPYHQNETLSMEPIPDSVFIAGEGTGIGNGILTGRAVFTMSDIIECRQKYPDEQIILVRPDTVSDDIDMIFEADGLLTSRGGATSHAAVTAVRLGKTGIVNCKSLQLYENLKTFSINGFSLRVLDKITIDGKRGFIYFPK